MSKEIEHQFLVIPAYNEWGQMGIAVRCYFCGRPVDMRIHKGHRSVDVAGIEGRVRLAQHCFLLWGNRLIVRHGGAPAKYSLAYITG